MPPIINSIELELYYTRGKQLSGEIQVLQSSIAKKPPLRRHHNHVHSEVSQSTVHLSAGSPPKDQKQIVLKNSFS